MKKSPIPQYCKPPCPPLWGQHQGRKTRKEKKESLIYYFTSCLPPLGCLLVLFLPAPVEKGKKYHHWSPPVHAVPKAYN